MKLTPPHRTQYGARNVEPGQFVEVAERDVDALLAEGWLLEALDDAEKIAEQDEPTDEDEEI